MDFFCRENPCGKPFIFTLLIFIAVPAFAGQRSADSDLFSGIHENDFRKIQKALADSANINAKIEYGADINVKNKEGKTALDIAIFHKSAEVIDLLKKHVAK